MCTDVWCWEVLAHMHMDMSEWWKQFNIEGVDRDEIGKAFCQWCIQ